MNVKLKLKSLDRVSLDIYSLYLKKILSNYGIERMRRYLNLTLMLSLQLHLSSLFLIRRKFK